MEMYAEYNLDKLKGKLKEIEDTFLGLRTPVGKFVCDENGLASDEKIKKLVDRVTSHQCWLCARYIGIGGVRKRYIELMFYLILRAYDPYDDVFDFVDFLEAARELSTTFKTREDLILYDSRRKPLITTRVFGRIKRSCMLLTGRSLSSDMTETELDRMQEVYEQKYKTHRDSLRKWEEQKKMLETSQEYKEAVREKYKDYGIKGEDDYFDALDAAIWHKSGNLVAEEEQDLSQRVLRKREKWIESFEDPEKYLNAYKEFCELISCVDVWNGAPNLENSIFYILEQEKLNKVGDNDKFVRLYAELNRALKIARRQL